jgi:hypothetical protein
MWCKYGDNYTYEQRDGRERALFYDGANNIPPDISSGVL